MTLKSKGEKNVDYCQNIYVHECVGTDLLVTFSCQLIYEDISPDITVYP